MCNEFILAIIYFLTIFLVNFFLLKLLKIYFSNVFYLLKLKNIFQVFKKSNNNFISLLYYSSKKETKNFKLLKNLNKSLKTNDILIIGNTFDYLSKSFQKENQNYYFSLLKNQYLSK